jgi:hypothetical protein
MTQEEWCALLHELMHFAVLVKPPLSMKSLDHIDNRSRI